MTSDELVTIGQVARAVGRSVETVRAWERDGIFQALRDPRTGYRLFRKDDVDALLETLRPRPCGQPVRTT
jgi:DNA (cytosine-5)-methyltransferase 1